MKFFLCLACVIIHSVILAQDFDQYKTLLPQGIIPKDFTELSSSKIASEITNISNKKDKSKKVKEKFIVESTIGINEFLTSGSVMFNDEVSVYLSDVLKELLKPYPDLQNKLRVYAVKSVSVNAFTTNNGIIFVNLGLLSRLESEAQLAFVLSHEIIHFKKKHVINKYITNIEIDESKDYRKFSVNEKDFTKSTFSKELESEADLAGSDIYASSPWAKDSVEKIFDVFSHSDFPLTWTPFSKDIFESDQYVFPDTLVLNSIRPLKIDEDYDDSKTTHPNIKKRRTAIDNRFKDAHGGELFKISKARFNTIKKIARYELCRQHLLEHRYVESLALLLSLRSENPKSTYLNESIAKSLYGIAKVSYLNKIMFDSSRWAGEAERLSTFIQKQSSYELNVLAIRELYKCKEATPGNVEISLMVNDLLQSFASKNENVLKNFIRTPLEKEIQGLSHPYTQYAFLDFKNVKDFFTLFEKQASIKKESKKTTQKKKSVKSKPLNINKVVVVSPIYKMVETRRRRKKKHPEKEEEVLININDKINEAAGKLDMKTEIINPDKLSKLQVVMMQNNSIMNDWIEEQFLSEEKTISPIYNEVMAIADQYKTDHFMWMGNIAIKQSKLGKGTVVAYALLVPALAPWSIAYLAVPGGRTVYFALVFNVRKQEIEMVDIRHINMKDSEYLLRSNIYYSLFKLKNSAQ